MRLSHRLLSVLAPVVVTLGVPQIATACSCTGFPTFEQVARDAGVVVVGRVVDTAPGPGQPPGTIIAYVDVEVSKVRKGKDVPRTIRIWDHVRGTSCEGGLEAVTLDGEMAFALERVTAETDRQLWKEIASTLRLATSRWADAVGI